MPLLPPTLTRGLSARGARWALPKFPHLQCRPWVGVVCHGTLWESTVFPNKTADFENDHAGLLTLHHLVTAAPDPYKPQETLWRRTGRWRPVTSSPRPLRRRSPSRRPMSRRYPGSARQSEKGTGDPIGSPAPSPFSVVQRLACPRFAPYPGSRPRQLRIDHTAARLRSQARRATANSPIHTVVPRKPHLSPRDPPKHPPPRRRQTACKPGSVPPLGVSAQRR